jgi:hypothetical protein
MATKPAKSGTRKSARRDDVPRIVTKTPIFRTLIDGKHTTEFHKAIAEDAYVSMILEYVQDRLRGPLLRKIRALRRAALIASACEDYAVNGKSAPL